MTPEQEEEYAKWLNDRPPKIQATVKRWPPGVLFRNDVPSGNRPFQRVYLKSYSEDGTVTVVVDGQFNLVTHERNVFDVDPETLTECDLPEDGELVGSLGLSVAEVRQLVALEFDQEAKNKLLDRFIAEKGPGKVVKFDRATMGRLNQ